MTKFVEIKNMMHLQKNRYTTMEPAKKKHCSKAPIKKASDMPQ